MDKNKKNIEIINVIFRDKLKLKRIKK